MLLLLKYKNHCSRWLDNYRTELSMFGLHQGFWGAMRQTASVLSSFMTGTTIYSKFTQDRHLGVLPLFSLIFNHLLNSSRTHFYFHRHFLGLVSVSVICMTPWRLYMYPWLHWTEPLSPSLVFTLQPGCHVLSYIRPCMCVLPSQ